MTILDQSELDRFVDLATQLYQINAAGGPLHVVLDDENLDGTIQPWYSGYTDAELDEPYHYGWRISELDPQAPAVVEGLGKSLRQLCDEIAELMNGWTEEQREFAVATWKHRSKSGWHLPR